MHIELPILGGHVPMGTCAPESMGFTVWQGDSVSIDLEAGSREQTDRRFAALAG